MGWLKLKTSLGEGMTRDEKGGTIHMLEPVGATQLQNQFSVQRP